MPGGAVPPCLIPPHPTTLQFLSKLVSLQGIVTRCTLVRPKVVKSVHWCEATNSFTSREYRDASSIEGLPTSTVYPTRDEQGNLLTTQVPREKKGGATGRLYFESVHRLSRAPSVGVMVQGREVHTGRATDSQNLRATVSVDLCTTGSSPTSHGPCTPLCSMA